MKKIINGKRYDTDTARKISSFQYSHHHDFLWHRETMYQKKTGEFFIHGEVREESGDRNELDCNSCMKSERLIPMTIKSAMDWAKKNLSVDEYETVFGEVSDKGEMPGRTQISFWVTEGQKKLADSLKATHAEIYASGLKALAIK